VCGCKNGGGACEAIYCGIVAEAFTPLFFSSGKVMSPEKWGMKNRPGLGPIWATSKFIVPALQILYAKSTILQIVFHGNFYRVACKETKLMAYSCHMMVKSPTLVVVAQQQCPNATHPNATTSSWYINQQINFELKTSADDADNDKESDQHQEPSSKVLRSMSNNKQSTTM
jgi:hypothetical protein